MTRQRLLACGVLSSALYAAMNLVVPLWWPGYSSLSRMVSELSAIGAPTRPLWVTLGFVYTALVVAFGCGIWLSAGHRQALRVSGALIVVYACIGVFWPPMHQREVLAAGGKSLTDTLHIGWTVATVLLMLSAMTLAAVALGWCFRWYTLVTMATLTATGMMAGTSAAAVEANLPTPWMGLWERLGIAGFLVWVVVLTVALWPPPLRSAAAAVAD